PAAALQGHLLRRRRGDRRGLPRARRDRPQALPGEALAEGGQVARESPRRVRRLSAQGAVPNPGRSTAAWRGPAPGALGPSPPPAEAAPPPPPPPPRAAALSPPLPPPLPAGADVKPFPAGFPPQEVAVAGATTPVRAGGKGPPVLLLHGFADTGDMWAPMA